MPVCLHTVSRAKAQLLTTSGTGTEIQYLFIISNVNMFVLATNKHDYKKDTQKKSKNFLLYIEEKALQQDSI
jgi:hypothetical protein